MRSLVGIRPPTAPQTSASKAKPVPETPPTEPSAPEWTTTREKSLSPLSAFTTSISISYDSLRRILLNDLQDLLNALDELQGHKD